MGLYQKVYNFREPRKDPDIINVFLKVYAVPHYHSVFKVSCLENTMIEIDSSSTVEELKTEFYRRRHAPVMSQAIVRPFDKFSKYSFEDVNFSADIGEILFNDRTLEECDKEEILLLFIDEEGIEGLKQQM